MKRSSPQARSLREASVARKIGALREAVAAAIETSLNRETRAAPYRQADVSELETRLRVVTGEVGEQRTALDHAFRTLGETPDAVLDSVTLQALAWIRQNSHAQLSPLQLSEWVHDVVAQSVQPSIARFRNIGQQAIESLRQIAKQMSRSDAPSHEDFEVLLRDLPRFELATLPESIDLSHWKILGERVLRSKIHGSLRDSIGSHLQEELQLYGMALSRWSEQVVRKLEALVNSYADAYRTQLHRAGGSGHVMDAEQMKADLDLLAQWSPEKSIRGLEQQRV